MPTRDGPGQRAIPNPTKAIPATRARGIVSNCGSVYYLPRPTSDADLAVMRRLNKLHMDFPFADGMLIFAWSCRMRWNRSPLPGSRARAIAMIMGLVGFLGPRFSNANGLSIPDGFAIIDGEPSLLCFAIG